MVWRDQTSLTNCRASQFHLWHLSLSLFHKQNQARLIAKQSRFSGVWWQVWMLGSEWSSSSSHSWGQCLPVTPAQVQRGGWKRVKTGVGACVPLCLCVCEREIVNASIVQKKKKHGNSNYQGLSSWQIHSFWKLQLFYLPQVSSWRVLSAAFKEAGPATGCTHQYRNLGLIFLCAITLMI